MPDLPHARLTVVKWVAYQPLATRGEDLSPPSFSQVIKSDEQIWRRTFTVGNQWDKVPLGWLEGLPISHLILFNEEGLFTQTIPTPEARAEAESRIVEIGVPGDSQPVPFTVCRPQQNVVFEPLGIVWIRCQTDRAKLTVTAIPL